MSGRSTSKVRGTVVRGWALEQASSEANVNPSVRATVVRGWNLGHEDSDLSPNLTNKHFGSVTPRETVKEDSFQSGTT